MNTETTKQAVDFTVSGGGTIYLVRPLTEAAREWLQEHIVGETSYLGPSLAVEHRYIADLVDGMLAAGLLGEPA